MIYYINKKNQLYYGDLQKGDRKATNEELFPLFKQQKYQELKTVRDEYKKENHCDNEQIVMNMLSGLGSYTIEQRDGCRAFFNDLIETYDKFKLRIDASLNKELLDEIIIDFNKVIEEVVDDQNN